MADRKRKKERKDDSSGLRIKARCESTSSNKISGADKSERKQDRAQLVLAGDLCQVFRRSGSSIGCEIGFEKKRGKIKRRDNDDEWTMTGIHPAIDPAFLALDPFWALEKQDPRFFCDLTHDQRL